GLAPDPELTREKTAPSPPPIATLIARCTIKPSVGEVPPAKRAIQGNPSTATICGQKTSPPTSPATIPRPNESKVRDPGPSGWRLIGSLSMKKPTQSLSSAA